jgi:hypothetical protein
MLPYAPSVLPRAPPLLPYARSLLPRAPLQPLPIFLPFALAVAFLQSLDESVHSARIGC